MPRKACVFCGATTKPITNEDLWPHWLRTFFPKVPHGYAERWDHVTGRQRFPQPYLTARVRAFCAPCNNGWMSKIETAAKPLVGPMAKGMTIALDPDQQAAVATWAVMKGLVGTQLSKTPAAIPETHFGAFHADRRPTVTTAVWIGCAAQPLRRKTAAAPTASLFSHDYMPLERVARGLPGSPVLNDYLRDGGPLYTTAIRIAHFFALVLRHDLAGLEARPVPGIAGLTFVPIWPTQDGTVDWPPALPIDSLGPIHRITKNFMMKPPEVAAA